MIGLDTNVLVRFLLRDDEEQYERARRPIRREAQTGEPACISLVVLLESGGGGFGVVISWAKVRSSVRLSSF